MPYEFIMWWIYLISLCGSYDTAHWGFLSVPLSGFINKQTILALKVIMDVDHKSEIEDVLNLYRKKIKCNFGAPLR